MNPSPKPTPSAKNGLAVAARESALVRRNVGEIVADHIRRLVFDGSLADGERVPQREIAEALGVSSIPVREALVALEREGENVLQGVTFSTTDAPDGGKALRIDSVPQNSLLAQHGVQSGDVLISVDGERMSTKSEVIDYVKRNKNKSAYDVVFQRRGVKHHKRVVIDR